MPCPDLTGSNELPPLSPVIYIPIYIHADIMPLVYGPSLHSVRGVLLIHGFGLHLLEQSLRAGEMLHGAGLLHAVFSELVTGAPAVAHAHSLWAEDVDLEEVAGRQLLRSVLIPSSLSLTRSTTDSNYSNEDIQ